MEIWKCLVLRVAVRLNESYLHSARIVPHTQYMLNNLWLFLWNQGGETGCTSRRRPEDYLFWKLSGASVDLFTVWADILAVRNIILRTPWSVSWGCLIIECNYHLKTFSSIATWAIRGYFDFKFPMLNHRAEFCSDIYSSLSSSFSLLICDNFKYGSHSLR